MPKSLGGGGEQFSSSIHARADTAAIGHSDGSATKERYDIGCDMDRSLTGSDEVCFHGS